MPTEYSAGLSSQSQPTINFVEDSPPRFVRIDLNRASVADLQRLPGVSAASARRIITARKKQKFNHVHDLLVARLITQSTFERIRKMVRANGSDYPYLTDLRTRPKKVLYRKPFELDVLFDDSISGVRLVRLQLESVSHSLDLTHEVTGDERGKGRITFELPPMEHGVMNIQVSLYDNDGNKDYLARTLPIFHNPPTVTFSPSERSLRLSNGSALMKSDGNFHCDSVFTISNGTTSTSTLNRNMTWRIFNQGGSLLESGIFSFGSNIVIGPSGIVNGWFTFSFPPGNVTFDRLRARESIRIRWEFTEIGTGSTVGDSLTWRALVGPHVNLIFVGLEGFTGPEQTRAINALRNTAGSIFQQQDVDIGTIRTFQISVARAGGYTTIDNDGEASSLTSDWTVPNDAMDLFIVRLYVGDTAGLSPAPGPCDKNAKGMNGSVVELRATQQRTGVIMAHELGHYLGLGHTSLTNNVMNPTINDSTTLLTSSQGNTMKGHCFVRFLG